MKTVWRDTKNWWNRKISTARGYKSSVVSCLTTGGGHLQIRILDASGQRFLDGIASIRYIADRVPAQGQKLTDAEDNRQDCRFPLEGSQHGEHDENKDSDGCNKARLVEHLLNLLHRAHQEARADQRKHISHCVEDRKDYEALNRYGQKGNADNRKEEAQNEAYAKSLNPRRPAQAWCIDELKIEQESGLPEGKETNRLAQIAFDLVTNGESLVSPQRATTSDRNLLRIHFFEHLNTYLRSKTALFFGRILAV